MQNRLADATEAELADVLISLDGRGPKNKKIALDILLRSMYYRGLMNQEYIDPIAEIAK
jgi:hypothetical protein